MIAFSVVQRESLERYYTTWSGEFQPKEKLEIENLAEQINLTEHQVQAWLRNRRKRGAYKGRTFYDVNQVRALEWIFSNYSEYPSILLKKQLAEEVNMTYPQVRKWFQSRRQRGSPAIINFVPQREDEWRVIEERLRAILARCEEEEKSFGGGVGKRGRGEETKGGAGSPFHGGMNSPLHGHNNNNNHNNVHVGGYPHQMMGLSSPTHPDSPLLNHNNTPYEKRRRMTDTTTGSSTTPLHSPSNMNLCRSMPEQPSPTFSPAYPSPSTNTITFSNSQQQLQQGQHPLTATLSNPLSADALPHLLSQQQQQQHQHQHLLSLQQPSLSQVRSHSLSAQALSPHPLSSSSLSQPLPRALSQPQPRALPRHNSHSLSPSVSQPLSQPQSLPPSGASSLSSSHSPRSSSSASSTSLTSLASSPFRSFAAISISSPCSTVLPPIEKEEKSSTASSFSSSTPSLPSISRILDSTQTLSLSDSDNNITTPPTTTTNSNNINNPLSLPPSVNEALLVGGGGKGGGGGEGEGARVGLPPLHMLMKQRMEDR